MKMLNSFFIILLLVIMAGCGGTQSEKSAKALLITQATIVELAQTADQMCTAGVLNQVQCDKVKFAYNDAKVSYDLAESSLSTALKLDSEDSWENYTVLHNNFTAIYTDLLNLAISFGISK